MELPNDPMILLSYINTKLRDTCPDLDELCKSLCVDRADIESKLLVIGYEYNAELGRFI